MTTAAQVLPVLQMILSFMNICVLGYGLFKFLSKPHNTLEQMVREHDLEIKEIKNALKQGNKRFDEQEDANEVLIRSVIALIEYLIQQCMIEQKPVNRNLEKAKDDLNDYLSSSKR